MPSAPFLPLRLHSITSTTSQPINSNNDMQTSKLKPQPVYTSFPQLLRYLTTFDNYSADPTRTLAQCIVGSTVAGTTIGTIYGMKHQTLSLRYCFRYSIQFALVSSVYMATSIQLNRIATSFNPHNNIHHNTAAGILNHLLTGSMVGYVVGGLVVGTPRGYVSGAVTFATVGTSLYIAQCIRQYIASKYTNAEPVIVQETQADNEKQPDERKKSWQTPTWFPIQRSNTETKKPY